MELDLLNLLLVLLVAWLAGVVTSRLGYPAVLGELLAGIVLGPPLLGFLEGGEALAVLAEVGLLLMMLYIGMEIDPGELGRASTGGLLAALGGFATPFVLCYFLAVYGAGLSPMGGVFIGTAAGVTSLVTKSRILVDLHLLDTRVAHVMMAGALVADTLSLVIFAGVIGVAEVGRFEPGALALVAAQAVGFFAAAALVGTVAVPWLMRRLAEAKLGRTALFTALVLVTLVYAEAAHLVGLHGILGAFLAGLFLREGVLGRSVSKELMGLVHDVSLGFLAPVFFVTAGFAVTLDVFQTDLPLLLGLIGLASVGKVVGTVAFYLMTGHGWREGMVIGMGMNGRGAVEIIIAQVALTLGLITAEVFSMLVFMAIATTALVPVTLKWGVEWLRRRGELVRSGEDRAGVLVVGAGPVARRLARALVDGGAAKVTLVDSSAANVAAAREEELAAVQGNALDERVLAEAGAAHARHVLSVTSNGEVNALVAQVARQVFLVPEVHVLHIAAGASAHAALLEHLGATTLFGGAVPVNEWAYLLEQERALRRRVAVTEREGAEALFHRLQQEGTHLPLAVHRGETAVPFHSGLVLEPGDAVVVLEAVPAAEAAHDRFDDVAETCPVLELDGPMTLTDLAQHAACALAPVLGLPASEVAERMVSREVQSSTVVFPGLAVPHLRVERPGTFALVVARCRAGVAFPSHDAPVVAAFCLATSDDQRHLHLRALAAIAAVAQQPAFERRWMEAPGEEALRDLLLQAERRREAPSPVDD
ncbi:MAG TPA: cation:proton antiporter [Rubricoccaceae bacterium]|nr:cation:proton antiporter [Rubricoccaceae bacterium]